MWSSGSERYDMLFWKWKVSCGVLKVKGMMCSSGSERHDVEFWKWKLWCVVLEVKGMMWSSGSEKYDVEFWNWKIWCGVLEVKVIMCSSGSERYDVEFWKRKAWCEGWTKCRYSSEADMQQCQWASKWTAGFCGGILVVPWPLWRTSCRFKNYIHQQNEKSYK